MLNSYNFLFIFSILILSYLLSFYFSKINVIKTLTHKKIWNIVLLFSFLISGIIGLMLAFMIDNKTAISIYPLLLWLHVEFGIIMAIISIFHIIWHIPYLKNIVSIIPKK
jgi:spermidine synthase